MSMAAQTEGKRIVFVSDVELGKACVEELIALGANIVGVFCSQEKPGAIVSGKALFDDVCARAGIPLTKVRDINAPESVASLKATSPDILFVIGFSRLVGAQVLAVPKDGAIGMHPTLLPRHRGRAPLAWTLICGLARSGVTMFYLKEEADTGAIIAQEEFTISQDDTAATLYETAKAAHVQLIKKMYPQLMQGKIPGTPQDESRASYWPKRTPKDGIIDWNQGAHALYDFIRGQSEPYPGAFTCAGKQKLTVWAARINDENATGAAPGMVVATGAQGAVVQAGRGQLVLTRVQREGGEMLRGEAVQKALKKGELLG